MQLEWIKCNAYKWCSFAELYLPEVTEHGVYIIWHGGQHPRVVYVGQGDVAERIDAHRRDQKIIRHKQKGTLFVTWASVSSAKRDGVERYLKNEYSPLEGKRHPEVEPIVVNSPWN